MITLEQVIERYPLPFDLEQLQKEDIHKLAHYGRALADLPVGYGKTVIGTVASLMLEPDTVVVILPPILIVQWVLWLNAITGKGTALSYTGDPGDRRQHRLVGKHWIVMSYVVFKNDIARITSDLKDSEVLVIVDEAHAVKNSTSQLYKAVRDFSVGRNLFLMTGTPMSSPVDAYAYIKMNSPQIYRTLKMFESIHVDEIDFFGSISSWKNLDVLQTNLNLRRVYRSKEEVHAELPKARFVPIYYDLSPAHMKLYTKLMNEQLLELENSGGKIDASSAQTLYHCAQQIITNYGYFADDETKRANVFDVLDQVCDEIALGQPGSSKIIIWTQYKMTSRRLLEYMKEKGNGRAVAAYSEADSKKSVQTFLEDPECHALVAQPGSAGAGLNPQHLCWECIFFETPTRTIPFTQAAGRIDRKGQRYNPTIRLAIARGTVQEGLLRNLMENDSLVTQVAGSIRGIRDLIFGRKK